MTTLTTTAAMSGAVAGAIAPAPPEDHVEKFNFDAEFQSKIAALQVRDTLFARRTDGLIVPEHFEDVSEACLVNIATRYFKRYKKLPGDRNIYARLIKDDMTTKVLRGEFVPGMVEKLKALWASDISDREYVVEKVATFARHQALVAAITASVPKLDRADFDGIDKEIRKAMNVGAHHDIDEYDYGTMIDARTGERLDRAAGKLPPEGITTGYPLIDDQLYHKGWGRRELSVLLGGAKAGKTTALMDFAINAISKRYNVLYITLEVASKIIAERMDSNISTRAMRELGSHIHDVREKVKEFMGKAGKFKIVEMPSGAMNIADLRRLMERYKALGFLPDLVVIDYADLMAPMRYTDDTIANSKSVYVDLRGFAMMENIAMLTATQTNREGHKASVAKAEHVADDFNKIRIADVVISINRTEEERAAGQARLFFAASRNQAGNFSIRIEQDLSRMKFVSKTVGIE